MKGLIEQTQGERNKKRGKGKLVFVQQEIESVGVWLGERERKGELKGKGKIND